MSEMKVTGFETDPEGNWQWLGWLDEVQDGEGIGKLLEEAERKSKDRDNYRAWYIDLNNMEDA